MIKAEGNQFEPITKPFKEHLQDRVDRLTSEFHAEVARHRGVNVSDVREGFGQGRMLMTGEAVGAKLCDGISSIEAEIMRGNRGGSGQRHRQGLKDLVDRRSVDRRSVECRREIAVR